MEWISINNKLPNNGDKVYIGEKKIVMYINNKFIDEKGICYFVKSWAPVNKLSCNDCPFNVPYDEAKQISKRRNLDVYDELAINEARYCGNCPSNKESRNG